MNMCIRSFTFARSWLGELKLPSRLLKYSVWTSEVVCTAIRKVLLSHGNSCALISQWDLRFNQSQITLQWSAMLIPTMECQINYISLFNNDYRLNFLNILVIVINVQLPITISINRTSYTKVLRSLQRNWLRIPQRVRRNNFCSSFVIKMNAQYLKKFYLSW